MSVRIMAGDCMEQMRLLEANSIDAVVTDPPYGIGFMGKAWDGKDIERVMATKTRKGTVRPDGWERHDGAAFAAGTYDLTPKGMLAFQLWTQQWAHEALRVLKPGGHLLSFSSPRTYHRMVVGIEDAGFEIRDQIMWVFGSGFPKSLNVGKALPEWDGWGTALKPAHEPIVLARKPLEGTVAENVLKHGTGGLHVDGCRVETSEGVPIFDKVNKRRGNTFDVGSNRTGKVTTQGRWPANLIHDGSDEVVGVFPNASGQQGEVSGDEPSSTGLTGVYGLRGRVASGPVRIDTGQSAARFFYCAKASKADRDEGCQALPEVAAADRVEREAGSAGMDNPRAGAGRTSAGRNAHPTVKPTDLMRYLVRLVTPPCGMVLDPFMGSGSTGKACVLEGMSFIGMEREASYLPIAEARIAYATVLHAEETAQGELFAA